MKTEERQDEVAGRGSSVARKALQKLLLRAENAKGKADSTSPKALLRTVSLRLSKDSFPEYLELDRHADKVECNAAWQLAERTNAISIEWDTRAGDRAHAIRLVLTDGDLLATHLGLPPRWRLIEEARTQFAAHLRDYSVLENVLAAWSRGGSVRGTRPGEYQAWLDGIRVLQDAATRRDEDAPIRRVSARLFGDSKRIEGLVNVLDALVHREMGVPAGEVEDVLSEIGVLKFPPTLLLSGEVALTYAGSTLAVPRPYLGVAPMAVAGISCGDSRIRYVLTIENLTTFHELARCRPQDVVVLYTGGMPSPSWTRVYLLLLNALPVQTSVLHWGDVDVGGFRIASHLAKCCASGGRHLQLHGMDGTLNPSFTEGRRPLGSSERAEIQSMCERWGWVTEGASLGQFAIEQEALPVAWPG